MFRSRSRRFLIKVEPDQPLFFRFVKGIAAIARQLLLF